MVLTMNELIGFDDGQRVDQLSQEQQSLVIHQGWTALARTQGIDLEAIWPEAVRRARPTHTGQLVRNSEADDVFALCRDYQRAVAASSPDAVETWSGLAPAEIETAIENQQTDMRHPDYSKPAPAGALLQTSPPLPTISISVTPVVTEMEMVGSGKGLEADFSHTRRPLGFRRRCRLVVCPSLPGRLAPGCLRERRRNTRTMDLFDACRQEPATADSF